MASPCRFSKPISQTSLEGTEFAVDEAADIIFEGHIPAARPEAAHDVLGTWKVVSDEREMSRLPRNAGELATLLKSRHAQIMEGRPDKGPGRFKADPNRAGSTLFVAPELVEGTLAKGFEIYRGLASPLHRAIFMMFLVSEVHPFADGNGRIARTMMNAELVAAGENWIIVPTVYRDNYLMALKALSQNRITGALVRTMDFAQRYSRHRFRGTGPGALYPGPASCVHRFDRGRRGWHPFDVAHARNSQRRNAALEVAIAMTEWLSAPGRRGYFSPQRAG